MKGWRGTKFTERKLVNIWGARTWTLKIAQSQVGPGWAGLIEKIWVMLPKDTLIEQIKEKYGTLRFYVDYVDEETQNFISEVERESGTVCEQCGEPGKLRCDRGWYITLCDKHHDEKERK